MPGWLLCSSSSIDELLSSSSSSSSFESCISWGRFTMSFWPPPPPTAAASPLNYFAAPVLFVGLIAVLIIVINSVIIQSSSPPPSSSSQPKDASTRNLYKIHHQWSLFQPTNWLAVAFRAFRSFFCLVGAWFAWLLGFLVMVDCQLKFCLKLCCFPAGNHERRQMQNLGWQTTKFGYAFST